MKIAVIALGLLTTTSAFAHANIQTYQCDNQNLRTGQVMGGPLDSFGEFDVNISKGKAEFFDLVGNPGQEHVRVKITTLSQSDVNVFSGTIDNDKLALTISEDRSDAIVTENSRQFACKRIN